MKSLPVHASPHLSLWQSAASETVAKSTKTPGHQTILEHQVLRGAHQYADSIAANQIPKEPGGGDLGVAADDPDVLAYMSFLNHQAVHAKINGDHDLQNQINKQRSRFQYGNPLWEQQWIQYFWYYWDYPFHKGQSPLYRSWQDPKFGNNNPKYGLIQWKIPEDATIALIGDIGTGTDIATAVLYASMTFSPDVILHVGDIYYSGTPFEFEHRFNSMYEAVMKQMDKRTPLFTIPGNHEYFTGAHGYFHALDGMRLVQHFDQKQEASYFALTTKEDSWQFLAMDTGYHGHYMDVSPHIQQTALDLLHHGKIEVPNDPSNPNWPNSFNPHFLDCSLPHEPLHDPTSRPPMITIRQDELTWHKNRMKSFTGRTILLSHHQLYSAIQHVGGKKLQPDKEIWPWVNTDLWNQFNPILEDEVSAWFWGHEHNLGIYQNDYTPEDQPLRTNQLHNLKKGRCVGHAALPVMDKEQPYEQKYPLPLVDGQPRLTLTDGWYNRGFQILQLQGKGKPAHVTYYELKEADPTPIPIYEEDIE